MRRKSRGYACLNTMKEACTISERIDAIPQDVKKVHINGHPYACIVTQLIEKLPNLKKIEITKKMKRNLSPRLARFLKTKGIVVSTGFHKPNCTWKQTVCRNPKYEEKKKIFASLTEDQQKLFRELLEMGFVEAQLLKRYLCLEGEEYLPLHQLPDASKYSPMSAAHTVSVKIQAVFKYLIPTLPSSKETQNLAKFIQKRVERIRRKEAEERVEKKGKEKNKISAQEKERALRHRRQVERKRRQKFVQRKKWMALRRKIIRKLNITELPKGLVYEELHTYAKLLMMEKSGDLSKIFSGEDYRETRMLLRLRYGLRYGNNTYRSHAEVGKILGIEPSIVRQIEMKAFEKIKQEKVNTR